MKAGAVHMVFLETFWDTPKKPAPAQRRAKEGRTVIAGVTADDATIRGGLRQQLCGQFLRITERWIVS